MTDTTTPPTPIIDGGPAFAAQGPDRYAFQTGMSLRDWFAGQALSGLLVPAADGSNYVRPFVELGKDAYLVADAMIAAQSQR